MTTVTATAIAKNNIH